MKNILLTYGADTLVKLVLPILLSFVVVPILDMLKRLWSWLDKQNGPVKDAFAFLMSGLATVLATAMGQGVPTDLREWNETLVKSILTWAVAVAMKRKTQVQTLKARAAAIPDVAQPAVADWRDTAAKP